jgi:outer membrane protease
MAITLSTAVRNARLDAIENAIGPNARLLIRTLSPPATVATASVGVVLADCALPEDWMAAASNGTKAKLGTWEDLLANAAGTAGHFELTASNGTTVHMRGTVTLTGGGGDMTVDNTSFQVDQAFTVVTFSLTDANAG